MSFSTVRWMSSECHPRIPAVAQVRWKALCGDGALDTSQGTGELSQTGPAVLATHTHPYCDYFVTQPLLPFSPAVLGQLKGFRRRPTHFSHQLFSPLPWCDNLVVQAKHGSLMCLMEEAGEEPWIRLADCVSPSYKLYTKIVLMTGKNTADEVRSKDLPILNEFSMGLGRRPSHCPWKP